MASSFFPIVFLALILPTLIVLIIAYVKSKKFYPLMYVLSIFAYINFVVYIIDKFDFGRGGITLTLAISAILLIIIGLFFSKIMREPNRGR